MNKTFTEFRKVELTLQRLTIIAEQVNEGVVVADLNGFARFVNAAMAKMHGYPSSKDLFGKNMSVFHSEDQMKTDVFPMLEEVKRKGRFLGPIEHLRNDGTVFPTQTKITQLKNGKDEAVGFIAFVTDITERMQVEKSFTKQIFELTAANERLQSEISKQRQTIEQLEQFRDGLQQQVSIMPLEKPFTEYAESEEMMSENTKESYKLKKTSRPILNEDKLRSLSEMAKRLSK
jgi:PAS domain S-box-containing protein